MSGGNEMSGSNDRWRASPWRASALRLAAVAVPAAVMVLAIWLLGDALWRPGGFLGTVAWLVQALAVGLVVGLAVDHFTRRLLPLAALYDLSLTFPGPAPSRVRVAARAATPARHRRRVDEVLEDGLGDDPATAAATAIELALALGHHDRLGRDHTERARFYADLLAEQIGLSDDDRDQLAWAVILHDVGKIAVPAEILNKPGRPTDEEWEVLRSHPAAGAELLEPLRDWMGPWGSAAAEHHERWDGTGYPAGLRADEISLAGRITAVADVFAVITSKSSYARGLADDAARQEMLRCAGTQFDPELVRLLLGVTPDAI